MHAVSQVTELKSPLASLEFRGKWDKDQAANIYDFDQKIAHTGIAYHAQYLDRWRGFRITVIEEAAATVAALISNLQRDT